VAIGGLFAGESMFNHVRDASKVALVALVDILHDEHVAERLLDVQWATPHLASLGVVEVTRREYLARLEVAVGGGVPCPRRSRESHDLRRTPPSLTIGRPAASHSSMPPARLTASTPFCTR
jgi:leucyl/phenylalanyl-tRNA--protein transferase